MDDNILAAQIRGLTEAIAKKNTIEVELADQMTAVGQKVAQIAAIVDKNSKVLFGPDGDDGLVFEVAHMKRSMRIIERIAWIIIGVVITSFVGSLIYIVATHQPGM